MRKSRNEMIVGLFVIVGFVMLSLVVFFISGVYLFRPGYHINALYDYVSIMDKGAPVRMAGVRVGEVSKVTLVPDPKTHRTRVQVTLFIDARAQIRSNSIFELRGTHVLSEPHVEITPVDGDVPFLKEGDTVEGVKLIPMENLIENAQRIAEGINQIINGNLNDTEGDMKEMVKQLKGSTDALNAILTKINGGEGTVGKLVSSEELYQDVRGLVHEIKAHPWRLLKKDSKYDNQPLVMNTSSGASSSPAQAPAKSSGKKFLFF